MSYNCTFIGGPLDGQREERPSVRGTIQLLCAGIGCYALRKQKGRSAEYHWVVREAAQCLKAGKQHGR